MHVSNPYMCMCVCNKGKMQHCNILTYIQSSILFLVVHINIKHKIWKYILNKWKLKLFIPQYVFLQKMTIEKKDMPCDDHRHTTSQQIWGHDKIQKPVKGSLWPHAYKILSPLPHIFHSIFEKYIYKF